MLPLAFDHAMETFEFSDFESIPDSVISVRPSRSNLHNEVIILLQTNQNIRRECNNLQINLRQERAEGEIKDRKIRDLESNMQQLIINLKAKEEEMEVRNNSTMLQISRKTQEVENLDQLLRIQIDKVTHIQTACDIKCSGFEAEKKYMESSLKSATTDVSRLEAENKSLINTVNNEKLANLEILGNLNAQISNLQSKNLLLEASLKQKSDFLDKFEGEVLIERSTLKSFELENLKLKHLLEDILKERDNLVQEKIKLKSQLDAQTNLVTLESSCKTNIELDNFNLIKKISRLELQRDLILEKSCSLIDYCNKKDAVNFLLKLAQKHRIDSCAKILSYRQNIIQSKNLKMSIARCMLRWKVSCIRKKYYRLLWRYLSVNLFKRCRFTKHSENIVLNLEKKLVSSELAMKAMQESLNISQDNLNNERLNWQSKISTLETMCETKLQALRSDLFVATNKLAFLELSESESKRKANSLQEEKELTRLNLINNHQFELEKVHGNLINTMHRDIAFTASQSSSPVVFTNVLEPNVDPQNLVSVAQTCFNLPSKALKRKHSFWKLLSFVLGMRHTFKRVRKVAQCDLLVNISSEIEIKFRHRGGIDILSKLSAFTGEHVARLSSFVTNYLAETLMEKNNLRKLISEEETKLQLLHNSCSRILAENADSLNLLESFKAPTISADFSAIVLVLQTLISDTELYQANVLSLKRRKLELIILTGRENMLQSFLRLSPEEFTIYSKSILLEPIGGSKPFVLPVDLCGVKEVLLEFNGSSTFNFSHQEVQRIVSRLSFKKNILISEGGNLASTITSLLNIKRNGVMLKIASLWSKLHCNVPIFNKVFSLLKSKKLMSLEGTHGLSDYVTAADIFTLLDDCPFTGTQLDLYASNLENEYSLWCLNSKNQLVELELCEQKLNKIESAISSLSDGIKVFTNVLNHPSPKNFILSISSYLLSVLRNYRSELASSGCTVSENSKFSCDEFRAETVQLKFELNKLCQNYGISCDLL